MVVLVAEEIQKTCKELGVRIKERFPNARLNDTCAALISISDEITKTNTWIRRPNYLIRTGSWICVALVLVMIIPAYCRLQVTTANVNIADFLQMLDSSFNVIVLAGATVIFLQAFENKLKRKRVITAINRLKCITHIVDAHQLKKDPRSTTEFRTASSPVRSLSDYELCRYLDYCSEILSLINMIAFLYVQNFEDPVAQESVNDLGELTNGLSQRIWQKIIIVDQSSRREHV